MKERLIKFAKAMRHQPEMPKPSSGQRCVAPECGFKFKRQQPIGAYIVDFVCFEARIGRRNRWRPASDDVSADQLRSKWLQSQGFRVLRFWNNDVNERKDDVLESIIRALREYPSQPLSHKGEGLERRWRPSGAGEPDQGSAGPFGRPRDPNQAPA
jgi:very-short-patch-repair endonuclease